MTGKREEFLPETIHPSGGATEIVVNQQQPSAGWIGLGVFAIVPKQNHLVEALGALVVARCKLTHW